MDSLVLELQKKTLDSSSSVSDLLQLALTVAVKLDLSDFEKWILFELKGYTNKEDIPPYRKLGGHVIVRDNYGIDNPVIFGDPKTEEIFSEERFYSPISEIEAHLSNKDGAILARTIPASVRRKSSVLSRGLAMFVFNETELAGIITAVRTTILEWSLQLEKAGVLGEGLSFSKSDKQNAYNVTYNIGSVSGIVGTIQNSNVQIGDYTTLLTEIDQLEIPDNEKTEFREIVKGLNSASEEERQSSLSKAVKWLGKNYDHLGGLALKFLNYFSDSSTT